MGRFRAWLSARGRFQFCLTVGMVTALTGVCGALILLPNSVLPKPNAAQAASVESYAQAKSDDPRLAAVRRTMEPFGALIARRVPTGDGKESIVVGHAQQDGEMTVLEGELGAATDAVTQVWGADWAQSVVVVVASNPSEFAALVHAGADMPTEIAAASVADPFAPGTTPTGQRVVFSPESGRRVGPAGLRTLLRHELTHVAARAKTADGAPLWMLEGFADYVAQHGQGHRFVDIAPTLTARLRDGDTPADLPADREFGGAQAAYAYERAWSVSEYVAEKYDQPKLVDLYRRVAAAKVDAAGEDRILRDALGVGRADFVNDWRAWLRRQIG
ncbi:MULTISPECIES: hypothetical protein [unclassified Nocardia]|uniref:hypothetical protein n=1 Tax=unclassified Nocardia TaxID=2637762 RepID=UPI001CE3D3C3|nr:MULTISPECIES: hypothetical protein [unclassified Nocardia]